MLKHAPGRAVGVEIVHTTIMDRAEELANMRVGQDHTLPENISGTIFRYDPVQSRSGGLTLSIEPMIDNLLTDEQRNQLYEVGADAIEDALLENQDIWVAGLLNDAHEGTNYFARFASN